MPIAVHWPVASDALLKSTMRRANGAPSDPELADAGIVRSLAESDDPTNLPHFKAKPRFAYPLDRHSKFGRVPALCEDS